MGEYGLGRYHHSEVVDFEAVAAQYYCHNVFSYVVNIALDGGEYYTWSVRAGVRLRG